LQKRFHRGQTKILPELENGARAMIGACALFKRSVPPHAIITSVLNATRADYIHMFRNAYEVLVQQIEVEFSLEQFSVDAAYKPSVLGEPVTEALGIIVF